MAAGPREPGRRSLHLLSTYVSGGVRLTDYWVLSVRYSYMPQFWLTKTFFSVGGR
ncbi:hypothetical protein HD596_010570 [Nonomuraea jabiensis]|uniref:Uncharacterized protein n=1 Tax=Nonomuraea jabiensis TaxID=882448 RepID=A0A7W9GHA3_9ACTN|nr:hypothetical protein [Nonomuraea jabiensis]